MLEWRVCGCLVLARCASNAKQFLRVLGFAVQQYAVVKAISLLVLLAAVHLLGPETSLRPVLVLTKAASLTSLVNRKLLFPFLTFFMARSFLLHFVFSRVLPSLTLDF